jgi:hypothetical protein
MPKETYYFSHDYGARNDPKLQKVLQKLGHEGKSVYWDIIEMIFEQGGKLLLSECDSYAFALRTDESCIIRLVNDFGLFENDGKYFWSESAKRRLDDRNSKSEKARSSANNRWKNANAQNNDANALQTHSDSNAIKESKVNESKVNERRDYTREEFFKSVLEFFGFSEISNFSNYKLLTEFCHSLAGSDRLEAQLH